MATLVTCVVDTGDLDDNVDTSIDVRPSTAASGVDIFYGYRFQGGLAGAEEDDLPGPAGIWGVFDGGL